MTIEEASALIDAAEDEYGDDPDSIAVQGLARGLSIIAKHAPGSMYSFQHDEGFFEFGPGITPAEVVELHRLGFRIDMRTDSWAKFS